MARKTATTQGEIGVVGTEYGFVSGPSGGFKAPDDPLRVFQKDKYKWQKEMVLNDPFIGANFKLITILGSKGDWAFKTKGTSRKDEKVRDIIKNILFDDMSHTFRDIVQFVLASEYTYGFAITEIVYKKRNDGYFGIDKLSRRLAPTIDEWDVDYQNNIKGIIQKNPNNHQDYYIPYDKILHFKIDDIIQSSPTGMSLTRNCFPAYYTKKYIEEQERVKVKKDARGQTVARIPASFLSSKDSKHIAFVNDIKKGLSNISNSNDSYIILPSGDFWDVDTLKIDGSLVQDTEKIIDRCDRYITVSQLSDFMLVGSKGTGSGNLIQTKVQIYSSFVGSLLDGICDVINKQLIPQLVEINNLKCDNTPYLTHTNLSELQNITAALFIQSAGATGLMTPSLERDNWITKRFLGSGCPEVNQERFDQYQANRDFSQKTNIPYKEEKQDNSNNEN